MQEGLPGDHTCYLSSSPPRGVDSPDGGMAPNRAEDLGFKVYAEIGPLPQREK